MKKALFIVSALLVVGTTLTYAEKRTKAEKKGVTVNIYNNVGTQQTPTSTGYQQVDFRPATEVTAANTSTRTHARDKFYRYSGKSALYILGGGYTYALPNTATKERGGHIINAELFNYRYRLLGLSLADFEMEIGPFNQDKKKWGGWISYRPSVKVYIPLAGAVSFYVYGGAQADATELLSKLNRNMTYDESLPYYKALNVFGGAALQCTAMRHVPLEFRAEYRHALRNTTFMPNGLYMTGRIMFGMPFNRSARGE